MPPKDTRDSQILNSVRQTYETIAESWDRVRRRPGAVWDMLLPYIGEGVSVLDVACGNGRLSEFLSTKNIQYTGIDGSQKLITIARERYPTTQFIVGDMQSLPFKDASFDVIACLAALQHLPSRLTRLQALHEMRRVVVPGGRLLMTNWNLYHPDMLFKFRLLRLLWGDRDVMVPWKLSSDHIVDRFYHSFLLRELQELLHESGWRVEDLQYANNRGRARWWDGMFSFAVAIATGGKV